VTERAYTSTEVMALTGITYRRLDWWVRAGYIRPSVRSKGGSGYPRLFSAEDVERVRLTKRLIEAGVSWDALWQDDDPVKCAARVVAAMQAVLEGAA
jgi:predicted site-specific integrase-resolvase